MTNYLEGLKSILGELKHHTLSLLLKCQAAFYSWWLTYNIK